MPIIRVRAGEEPVMFSVHFHAWDPEYTKKNVYVDPYQAKLDALAAHRAAKLAGAAAAGPNGTHGEHDSASSAAVNSITGAPINVLSSYTAATGAAMRRASSTATTSDAPATRRTSTSTAPVTHWEVAVGAVPRRLSTGNAAAVATPPIPPVTTDGSAATAAISIATHYSFAELSSGPLPPDVHAPSKEQYLHDSEFAVIFGMSKAEFNDLKKWKRDDLKKKKGLF
jgi:hypothetical protein